VFVCEFGRRVSLTDPIKGWLSSLDLSDGSLTTFHFGFSA
jgi:hypothetical protein